MTKCAFSQRCQAEWQRLNPQYVRETDGFFKAFVAACRETMPGYFAPMRFLWWLAAKSWRQTDGGIGR